MEAIQTDKSSKALVYRGIKEGYQCEPYIQPSLRNRHFRSIMARFRTGSHWLHVETGRHTSTDRSDRTCPKCQPRIISPGLPAEQFGSFDSDDDSSGPIEDKHHMIFECSGYTEASALSGFIRSADCDCWPISQPAESSSLSKVSHLGKNDAYEPGLV